MPATDLEKLVVQLSGDIKAYERSMDRALGLTNKRARTIENRFAKMNKGVAASFARTGLAIGAAFAGSAAVRELGRLSDAATKIDNALKVAGLSGRELEDTYAALSKAAKENSAPIGALVDLYSKVSLVQNELNVSSEDLIKFSGNVALALRVAGTDAQAASGALLQLSQALGGGTVRAEEFNSILEGAPTIARAAAAGLKEAGGSVSELRKLVIDGKLSSEAFFRAFEAGSVVLEQQAKSSVVTLGQAATNLQNALINAAREFNVATGAGEQFAGGLNKVADAIGSIEFDTLISKIREARAEFDAFLAGIDFAPLGKALGVITEDGLAVNIDKKEAEEKVSALEREVETLQATIEKNSNLGFDNTEALARIREVTAALAAARATADAMSDTAAFPTIVPGAGLVQQQEIGGASGASLGGPRTRGGRRRQAAVDPVSIRDFKPPIGSKSGSKSRSDELEREIEQIKARTAAISAETLAQAGLNPLIDDYGFAIEKARAKHELLTAAQQAGKKVTPELAAEIENLSTAYALAIQESEKLAEKQDQIRERAEEALAAAKDVTRGLIDGLIEGTDKAELMADALKKIGSALIDDVLSSIFKVNGAGGGFLSQLFGLGGGGGFNPAGKIGLFSNGGFTGPGGRNQPAGVVHRGEVVWSQRDVARAGGVAAVEAMRRGMPGYADGGPVAMAAPSMPRLEPRSGSTSISATYAPVIDARGADMAAIDSLKREMARDRAEFSGRVVAAVTEARRRNVKI